MISDSPCSLSLSLFLSWLGSISFQTLDKEVHNFLPGSAYTSPQIAKSGWDGGVGWERTAINLPLTIPLGSTPVGRRLPSSFLPAGERETAARGRTNQPKKKKKERLGSRTGRVTVPAVSEIGNGRWVRREGKKEKGNNCFSHRPKKRVHECFLIRHEILHARWSFSYRATFSFSFSSSSSFFTPSSVLPLSRPPVCTAFYHHRRFPPLLGLLCRFVSAFAASFRDELIKPDRSYRPEILTRGSRRR